MDLSIIIVNWNSREYLRKCLVSIEGSIRSSLRYEVVVIDSGSFDGCAEMLRAHHPQVVFIQSQENLGFARANNQAFERSTGQCVLFLNPDTEIIGPAIEKMYEQLMTLSDAGVIGCKLLNGDASVQTSCIQSIPTIPNQMLNSELLRAWWPKSRLWGMAPLFEDGHEACEVEVISGACVMTTRKAFEQVGRFNEEYFMYSEDVDLSHEMRATGRRNYYVPGVSVIHYGGSSTQQAVSVFSAVMIPEATARFLKRTRGTAYSLAYRLSMLLSAAGRVGVLGAAWATGQRTPSTRASLRKWVAILRWSVSCDGVVGQYYRAR